MESGGCSLDLYGKAEQVQGAGSKDEVRRRLSAGIYSNKKKQLTIIETEPIEQ